MEISDAPTLIPYFPNQFYTILFHFFKILIRPIMWLTEPNLPNCLVYMKIQT